MAMLVEEYSQRLKSRVRLEIHSVKLVAREYLSSLPDSTILLDEGGEEFTSTEFAERFAEWTISQEDTHLAIGPADGFPKNNGYKSISLSTMTMPHELAAVVLMEQLYRSYEIGRGSAYHRA